MAITKIGNILCKIGKDTYNKYLDAGAGAGVGIAGTGTGFIGGMLARNYLDNKANKEYDARFKELLNKKREVEKRIFDHFKRKEDDLISKKISKEEYENYSRRVNRVSNFLSNKFKSDLAHAEDVYTKKLNRIRKEPAIGALLGLTAVSPYVYKKFTD